MDVVPVWHTKAAGIVGGWGIGRIGEGPRFSEWGV